MRSIFFFCIILIILSISSPLMMMAEELGEEGGGGGGLSAASTELANQLPQNEQSGKVETNTMMADHHQQILSEHASARSSAKPEEKAMGEKNENKMNPNQSGDGYQSNIPSEYRKYVPPPAAAGGHEQGNSQPSMVPNERERENRENINGGGDYQKYIPKEYQPYASGNGNAEGQEGSMRVKKTKEEAEVKVHERGEYYEDYRASSSYGGEQPQQDESWRQYVPPPYRKYLPDYIPSEEHHHIHHHEKHHIHHHEEPLQEHPGKENEKETKEADHEEVKKAEEKESKVPHHHHDEKKEEKEEKAHHAAHDHHAAEKEKEKEKEKDHECKEEDHPSHHHRQKHEKENEKECDHHHEHKLMDSASMTEQQMVDKNIAVDHSVEANLPENDLPHDQNNNNHNSGGSSSSIWVSIGVCSTIVLSGSLLYYFAIKGLSRYRQSKEIKEIIVDEDIGRIPATAMEKTHLLDREIRIYQQILQNEPAMKV